LAEAATVLTILRGESHFFCNAAQNFRKEWVKEMIHEKEPK